MYETMTLKCAVTIPGETATVREEFKKLVNILEKEDWTIEFTEGARYDNKSILKFGASKTVEEEKDEH